MMLIVVPPKRINLLLRVVDRREPMHVQTFFAESSVERLDRRVVRRLAPTTEIENDAVGICPEIHCGADELRAVVAVDPLRQPAFEAQSLERGHNIATTETVAHVDREAFTREQIEHGQGAESSPIGELIGHKVHTPNVIASDRWSSLLAVHGGCMSPRTLPPERQSLLGVEAIAPLLPELPAFAPQQHEESTIPEANTCLRQLSHPLAKSGQRIAAALITNAGQTETRGSGRPALAHLVPAHQVVHHFTLLDGLQNFF